VYCFTYEREWIKYENVVSNIFDHLFTIISDFELEVFEEPTGDDFRNLSR
jgi:miniconductance mechanosensitive channel